MLKWRKTKGDQQLIVPSRPHIRRRYHPAFQLDGANNDIGQDEDAGSKDETAAETQS